MFLSSGNVRDEDHFFSMDLPIFTHERIEELLGKDSGIGVSDTLSTNSSYCAICTDVKQKKKFLNQHTEMAR